MADIYEKFEHHAITLTTANKEYAFPTPEKYSGGWEISIGSDSILPTNSDEVLKAVASADNQKLLVFENIS